MEPEVPFEMPAMRPARNEDAPRRAYVMKRHYDEHGYTEGCEGCSRLSAKMKSRPHSNACRERMYRELKGTEEGRKWIEESEARIGDYLESKVRDEHGDREHEVEEKAKEEGMSSSAVPTDPLVSGEAAASPSTSRSKEARKQTPQTDGPKKVRIAADGDSKNSEEASRPRGR